MDNLNFTLLSEHFSKTVVKKVGVNYSEVAARLYKTDRGKDYHVYKIKSDEASFHLKADYFVGIDWLVEGEHVVQVDPKINTKIIERFNKQLLIEDGHNNETQELDKGIKNSIKRIKGKGEEIVELNYLKMLLEVMSHSKTSKEVTKLVLIDWEQSKIPITQKQDKLTPFLVVQFLQLLKSIVKKGLKKSYYKEQRNLQNRAKGKIVMGQHIKSNVLKHRLTSTYCEYQIFGVDNLENRFLKKVFRFASAYIENNKFLFGSNIFQIQHTINFCRPPFENISQEIKESELKKFKYNPFFKEYKEAIVTGKLILQKFSYNITKMSDQKVTTPPFWIDMPQLFELYFYSKLLKANPEIENEIHFQFSTYGNSLDFLISAKDCEMVIDTKYKTHYKWGKVHEDIRQISGYARLNKVRKKLRLEKDENRIIDCLIVYPEIRAEDTELTMEHIQNRQESISAYKKVYKLGITLPVVSHC